MSSSTRHRSVWFTLSLLTCSGLVGGLASCTISSPIPVLTSVVGVIRAISLGLPAGADAGGQRFDQSKLNTRDEVRPVLAMRSTFASTPEVDFPIVNSDSIAVLDVSEGLQAQVLDPVEPSLFGQGNNGDLGEGSVGSGGAGEGGAGDGVGGDDTGRDGAGNGDSYGDGAVAWGVFNTMPFSRFYPKAAMADRHVGYVVLDCSVSKSRKFRCSVARENPQGLLFGKAALDLLPNLRANKKLVQAGKVKIAILFCPPLVDGEQIAGACIERERNPA